MGKLWMIRLGRGMPILAAGLIFLLFICLCRQHQPERILLRTYRELSGLVKRQKVTVGWYQKMDAKLVRNGARFHYGMWINPPRYLAMRIVLAALGVLVLFPVSAVSGALAALMLFSLPDCLLLYLNGKDNEKLLPELKLVYHALEIQIRAGVYVTDALTECYGSVQNKRLRGALLDLAGDIVMKADIYKALENFQAQFDNRYIDSLCLIILQALESGQALELLGDIGEQIKDMEENLLERKKAALDRSITFYQLGILTAVLGISLYVCIMHMMGAARGF